MSWAFDVLLSWDVFWIQELAHEGFLFQKSISEALELLLG